VNLLASDHGSCVTERSRENEIANSGEIYDDQISDGGRDDAHIERQAHSPNVVKIVANFAANVFDTGVGLKSNLRQTGESRPHIKSFAIARHRRLKIADQFRPFRARADETHFTANDVVQLRQLVQVSEAKQSAESRHAGIVAVRPDRPGLTFAIENHRSEFVNPIPSSVPAQPYLGIERRTPVAR